MTDKYGRAFTFTHDWAGGIVLAETATGLSVYFQPGDDASEVDDYYDHLVGDCGYDGQYALKIIWDGYSDLAA